MAAVGNNQPRNVPPDESVLDAKYRIHPGWLRITKITFVTVGGSVAVVSRFVPGLYSYGTVAGSIAIAVMVWFIFELLVDNPNDASRRNQRIKLAERRGPEVSLSRSYSEMSYEGLKILGRRQSDDRL